MGAGWGDPCELCPPKNTCKYRLLLNGPPIVSLDCRAGSKHTTVAQALEGTLKDERLFALDGAHCSKIVRYHHPENAALLNDNAIFFIFLDYSTKVKHWRPLNETSFFLLFS